MGIVSDKKLIFNRSRIDDAEKTVNVVGDGWGNVLTGLGVRGRDKNVATTFRMCMKMDVSVLDQLYRSDGMSRRVIDLVPEEMIRQGWEIENDPEGMVGVKFDELNINCVMMNMLRWSRLYGGSLGVIGVADGRPLEEPLNKNNIRDVRWIHVFDRYSVSSADGTIDQDLNSPNYGKPIHYLVTDPRTGGTFVVHYSRTIRCDWNELTPRWAMENDSWADPLFQSIYEELKNYSVAFANCGILIHDFVNYVLKIPGLGQLLASECGSSDIQKRINLLNLTKSSLNTMIIDGEESYEKQTTNISGISDLLDRFMLSLSAVTGIPITLLFGRAPAGLNATGDADIRNFYDMISQKQEGKLRPMLEKLVELIFLSKDGYYKGIEPKDWKIEFNPLWQNTEREEADIRRTVAETDSMYIDRGVLDPTEVAVSRFGGSAWTMNTELSSEERDTRFNEREVLELEKEKEQEQLGNPDISKPPVSNENTPVS